MNFINNENLNKQYNKLKLIFLAFKTKEDAHNFLDKYKLDTRSHYLMVSLINGKKYENALSYDSMLKYIKDIVNCKYREDAYEIISQALKQTSDIAQIKTFTRIADNKPDKPQYITLKELRQREKENMSSKKCPHCGYRYSAQKHTIYTVCGYGGGGYDWEGCGKDWCFKCGKMLCKSWEQDQLYLLTNRLHDQKHSWQKLWKNVDKNV